MCATAGEEQTLRPLLHLSFNLTDSYTRTSENFSDTGDTTGKNFKESLNQLLPTSIS